MSDYIYTDGWKMFNDIKDRNEQVLCCDVVDTTGAYIGYCLNPSGDTYKIKAKDLRLSLESSPGWKADLIKLALTTSEGKHNLAISLSGDSE